MKVLILDASYENTLAIIRHLGSLGSVEVSAIGYYRLSISFFSRYCRKSFVIENPNHNEEGFLSQLITILKEEKYDLLIPVGYKTSKLCTIHQNEIKKHTNLIVPSIASFNIASSKVESCKLAKNLGLGHPLFWQPTSVSELKNIPLKFPIVIKSPLEIGRKAVSYVQSEKELPEKFNKTYDIYKANSSQLPLIQEFINGPVYSFFAYYDNGVCKAYFMHKRVREFPLKGGSAVCAESIHDKDLLHSGKAMLDSLNWNGVAMIEFKKDERDGIFKLIEINPKFWKTVEMPIVAGINFPYFLLQKVKNEPISLTSNYKKIRFHWIIYGELYHFFSHPQSLFAIIRDMFTAENDIWIKDFKPHILQLCIVPFHLYKRILGKL